MGLFNRGDRKEIGYRLPARRKCQEAGYKKTPTNNPQSYDNFLRGRFLLNKANSEQRVDINKEGLMASLKYFEKA